MTKKLTIGNIVLRFTFPNGVTGRYEFRSLGAARRFAQHKMGTSPDIGETYAVNRYGDMTLRVTGTSLTELFPEAEATKSARAPSLRVPRGLVALQRRLAASGSSLVAGMSPREEVRCRLCGRIIPAKSVVALSPHAAVDKFALHPGCLDDATVVYRYDPYEVDAGTVSVRRLSDAGALHALAEELDDALAETGAGYAFLHNPPPGLRASQAAIGSGRY